MGRRSSILLPAGMLLVVLLAGCTHTSPFTEDYFYRAVGTKGDAVVTVDLERSRSLYEQTADDQLRARYDPIFDRTKRLSVAVDPATLAGEPVFSGGAEGDFGRRGVNTLLRLSGDFQRTDGEMTDYYVDASGRLRLMLPESGLVLFSSQDVERVYRSSYEEREILIPYETAAEMSEGLFAIYMEEPKDLSLIIDDVPEKLVASIDAIWMIFHGHTGAYTVDGKILVNNRAAGRVLSTTMKIDYLGKVRAMEAPPENWKEHIDWVDDLTVRLEAMMIEDQQVVDLFATVLEQM